MIRFILAFGLVIASVKAGKSKQNVTASADYIIPAADLYEFGNNFYVFLTITQGSYYQATQFCNAYGFELVSIETPEENQFLYEKLRDVLGKGEYHIWTSGTALVNENHTFYWLSTGQKVGYSSWQPHQPDNAGGEENCLSAIYNKKEHKTLVWNDNVCTNEQYFICELNSKKCANELDSACNPFTVIKD